MPASEARRMSKSQLPDSATDDSQSTPLQPCQHGSSASKLAQRIANSLKCAWHLGGFDSYLSFSSLRVFQAAHAMLWLLWNSASSLSSEWSQTFADCDGGSTEEAQATPALCENRVWSSQHQPGRHASQYYQQSSPSPEDLLALPMS